MNKFISSQYGKLSFATITLSLLAACGGSLDSKPSSSSTPTNTVVYAAKLDETSCPYRFDASQTLGRSVRCGYLITLQDRQDARSPEIRIPFAVFAPTQASTAPPVFNLIGGPGQTWLDITPNIKLGQTLFGDPNGKNLLRAEVLIEQRGSDATQPSLRCKSPEWNPETSINPVQTLQTLQSDLKACRESLQAKNVRISGFNTNDLAADINDLRKLLGYPKIALNGVSYGTEWALRFVRDYPDAVDMVVLDSLVQQSNRPLLNLSKGVGKALEQFSTVCSADKNCQPGTVDVLTQVDNIVGALNANPLAWAKGPDGKLTSGAFINGLQFLLSFEATAIPGYLNTVQSLVDSVTPLDALPAESQDSLLLAIKTGTQVEYTGQFLSISCADNSTVGLNEIINGLAEVRPTLRTYAFTSTGSFFDVCKNWPAKRNFDDATFQRVQSKAKILILSGAFDALTPRAWAEDAVQSLPNAILVRFPFKGHAIQGGSACANGIIQSFLKGEKIDKTCSASDF
jgi:pimeloyl-ACP methyl ester carboxylesterase